MHTYIQRDMIGGWIYRENLFMPYTKNDKRMLTKVEKIIHNNEEVFVEHYSQRAYEFYYFIKSLNELNDLLNRIGGNDFVTIYKNKQLIFRGMPSNYFTDRLKAEYLKMEGTDYLIYDYVFYPQKLELYGSGSSSQELDEDLEELFKYHKNLKFCFGVDPRSIYRLLNISENDEAIIISGI